MSRLRDEIKQTRPFESTGQEAALGLLRTADLLRHVLTAALDPYGVTLQQYNVLRILRGAGEDGLPTLEIADRMIERAPGITRLLDRLERKTWVRRERCRHDRRRVYCQITGDGLELLAQLDEPVNRGDAAVFDSLPERDQRSLIAILDRVRANIAEEES